MELIGAFHGAKDAKWMRGLVCKMIALAAKNTNEGL